MKKLLLKLTITLVLTLSFATPFATNFAQAKDFGLGVIFGDPTAITGKYWKDSQTAYDFGMAFALSDYFLLYGDYLFHYPGAFGRQNNFVASLVPYFGVGGIFVTTTRDRTKDNGIFGRRSGSFGIGARIPLGVEWRPHRPSLGVFLEIAPGITVLPETSALFEGGVGIRYYF